MLMTITPILFGNKNGNEFQKNTKPIREITAEISAKNSICSAGTIISSKPSPVPVKPASARNQIPKLSIFEFDSFRINQHVNECFSLSFRPNIGNIANTCPRPWARRMTARIICVEDMITSYGI